MKCFLLVVFFCWTSFAHASESAMDVRSTLLWKLSGEIVDFFCDPTPTLSEKEIVCFLLKDKILASVHPEVKKAPALGSLRAEYGDTSDVSCLISGMSKNIRSAFARWLLYIPSTGCAVSLAEFEEAQWEEFEEEVLALNDTTSKEQKQKLQKTLCKFFLQHKAPSFKDADDIVDAYAIAEGAGALDMKMSDIAFVPSNQPIPYIRSYSDLFYYSGVVADLFMDENYLSKSVSIPHAAYWKAFIEPWMSYDHVQEHLVMPLQSMMHVDTLKGLSSLLCVDVERSESIQEAVRKQLGAFETKEGIIKVWALNNLRSYDESQKYWMLKDVAIKKADAREWVERFMPANEMDWMWKIYSMDSIVRTLVEGWRGRVADGDDTVISASISAAARVLWWRSAVHGMASLLHIQPHQDGQNRLHLTVFGPLGRALIVQRLAGGRHILAPFDMCMDHARREDFSHIMSARVASVISCDIKLLHTKNGIALAQLGRRSFSLRHKPLGDLLDLVNLEELLLFVDLSIEDGKDPGDFCRQLKEELIYLSQDEFRQEPWIIPEEKWPSWKTNPVRENANHNLNVLAPVSMNTLRFRRPLTANDLEFLDEVRSINDWYACKKKMRNIFLPNFSEQFLYETFETLNDFKRPVGEQRQVKKPEDGPSVIKSFVLL